MSSPESEHARWFVAEVHPHDQALKRYLRSSFPAVRDVDDLVQESYLRIWRRQLVRPVADVSGSVTASVKSFLFQVARRLAIDALRRDRASPVDRVTEMPPSSVMDERASADEIASRHQEFELVLEAIDTLPTRCRQVVVLRKLQRMSPRETADFLGISEETVHVQTRRGLQRIQAWLRARGINDGGVK